MKINVNKIQSLNISLASTTDIKDMIADNREISEGNMYLPRSNEATIQYQKNGLFDDSKFGSYDDIKKTGNCGYIKLEVPVAHIWFFKNQSKILSQITDLPQTDLEDILYYNKYLVLEKITKSKDHDTDIYTTKRITMPISAYLELKSHGDNQIYAEIGGTAILHLLEGINLPEKIIELKTKLNSINRQAEKQTIIKKLNILQPIADSGNQLRNLMLEVLPVIPLRMRNLKRNIDGSIECSHINTLYKRIIDINNRIKKSKANNSSLAIQFLEMRALQEAVDSLLAYDKRNKNKKPLNENDPYESLTNRLISKTGHFRNKVLGKRVDYSGRAVITVAPDLKINQCGLPQKIAFELFWPFIYGELRKNGYLRYTGNGKNTDIVSLNNLLAHLSDNSDSLWLHDKALECLHKIMAEKVILLNRAPTLHRHSIMAFKPVLNEENCDAIRLHPLVCSPFNADFDGDTMTVYLPLSDAAQKEAKEIMSVGQSLLSSGDGSLWTSLSQDAVLGAYYYTYTSGQNTQSFPDIDTAMAAYRENMISLQQPIRIKMPVKLLALANFSDDIILNKLDKLVEEDNLKSKNSSRQIESTLIVETSIGNILFYSALFDSEKTTKSFTHISPYLSDYNHLSIIPFEFKNFDNDNMIFKLNKLMDKKELKKFIIKVYKTYGTEYTLSFLDKIKNYANHIACISGLSISAFDVDIPQEYKKSKIEEVEKIVRGRKEHKGNTEFISKKNIKDWNTATEEIFEKAKEKANRMNPLHRMIESGARGDQSNYKQVIAMRGIMQDTAGNDIPEPIKHNFTEGLSSTEYFTSSSGARLGLIDTALHTADPGYFARILTYAVHDVIVTSEDCCVTKLDLEKLKQSIEEKAQELNNTEPALAFKQYLINNLCGNLLIEYVKNDIVHKQSICIDEAFINTIMTDPSIKRVTYRTQEIPGFDIKEIDFEKADDKKNTEHVIIQSLEDRIRGRYLAKDYGNIFKAGTYIDSAIAKDLAKHNTVIRTRSPITCKCRYGICRKCFGLDLATQRIIKLGTAIGIIAAQTISEKGTQMNLKSFHSGGISGSGSVATGITEIKRIFNAAKNNSKTNFKKDIETQFKKKVEPLEEQKVSPTEINRAKANIIQEIADDIIKKVLAEYNTNKIDDIDTKIIETLVRKMLNAAIVKDSGDSLHYIGQELNKYDIEEENKLLNAFKVETISSKPTVQGITELARNNQSFLSTSAFGYLASALTINALAGSSDSLKGIIENAVLGKLIPVGDDAY